jgi:hypothetical protein
MPLALVRVVSAACPLFVVAAGFTVSAGVTDIPAFAKKAKHHMKLFSHLGYSILESPR